MVENKKFIKKKKARKKQILAQHMRPQYHSSTYKQKRDSICE